MTILHASVLRQDEGLQSIRKYSIATAIEGRCMRQQMQQNKHPSETVVDAVPILNARHQDSPSPKSALGKDFAGQNEPAQNGAGPKKNESMRSIAAFLKTSSEHESDSRADTQNAIQPKSPLVELTKPVVKKEEDSSVREPENALTYSEQAIFKPEKATPDSELAIKEPEQGLSDSKQERKPEQADVKLERATQHAVSAQEKPALTTTTSSAISDKYQEPVSQVAIKAQLPERKLDKNSGIVESSSSEYSKYKSKIGHTVSNGGSRPPTVWENPSFFTVYKSDGKKFFQCRSYGSCSMQFTRAEHLARHIRKHTGEKPYRCGCRQYFSRLDNLRQHCASAHPSIDLKYETTRSGYRSGIELAPGQKSPCPDEEEYLESIGIDPEFKAKGNSKGVKRRNTVVYASQHNESAQPPRKAKNRTVTLDDSSYTSGNISAKDLAVKTSERKLPIRKITTPTRKFENGAYAQCPGANGVDLLHPLSMQRNMKPRIDRQIPLAAIGATWTPEYGSRISISDISGSQFRLGGLGHIEPESHERESVQRRHSWQCTDVSASERAYRSFPMVRHPGLGLKLPELKQKPDGSFASQEVSASRNDAEIDCLQALADLKALRSTSLQSVASPKTADSSSASSDEAEPTNSIPSHLEPGVHQHPCLEWKPDNFRFYVRSIQHPVGVEKIMRNHMPPPPMPQAISQDSKSQKTERISINRLLA